MGKITNFWTPLEKMGFPGKLVDSLHIISSLIRKVLRSRRYGRHCAHHRRKKKKEEAVGRIIGIQPRGFVRGR
jgi:hypothetical protein